MYNETEIPLLTRISLHVVLTNLVNTNFAQGVGVFYCTGFSMAIHFSHNYEAHDELVPRGISFG